MITSERNEAVELLVPNCVGVVVGVYVVLYIVHTIYYIREMNKEFPPQ
jgi:hypothetical protein